MFDILITVIATLSVAVTCTIAIIHILITQDNERIDRMQAANEARRNADVKTDTTILKYN